MADGSVAKGIATERRQYAENFQQADREIARARHVVARTLRSWGMEADVPALELLTSELMSNAVRHGKGPIQLWLTTDGVRVRLEVADAGQGRPQLVGNRVFGGWGLRFVDQLAESWGTQERADGKMVWMVVRRAHPASGNGEPGHNGTNGYQRGNGHHEEA